MSEPTPTLRVKPWSQEQGSFVIIETAHFDEAVHTLYDGPDEVVSEAAAPATEEAALETAPETDPLDHDGDGEAGGSLPAEPTDDPDQMTSQQLRDAITAKNGSFNARDPKADLLANLKALIG